MALKKRQALKAKRKAIGRPPHDPAMLTRNGMAAELGTALSNVQRYFRDPTAPKLDAWGRCHRSVAIPYLLAKQQRAGFGASDATKAIKAESAALDLEEKKMRVAALRKETISRKEMEETVSRLFTQLFAAFRQRFVDELPAKYQGKTEIERRQINESAYNQIAQGFREGGAK